MLGLHHRSSLLALFFLSAACGDGNAGGGLGGMYGEVSEDAAPNVFAREYCHLLLSACDCTTAQQIFSSTSQCESAMAMQLEADFAEAQAAGLTYDPTCMGEYVNLFTQELGCRTRTELTPTVAVSIDAPTCKVHYGTGVEGDSCENHYTAFGDTCEPGLQCLGTCMAFAPQPVNKAIGEACDPTTDLCELGSYCDGSVCIAQPRRRRGVQPRSTVSARAAVRDGRRRHRGHLRPTAGAGRAVRVGTVRLRRRELLRG